MALGVLCAMPEEIDALIPRIERARVAERAGRRFVHGTLLGSPVVAVFSRWGKVAAASTTTELIVAHGVSRVVLCGIAGGLDATLAPGDVVVASELVQHDLDASPFFPPGVVPLLGTSRMPTDDAMSAGLLGAAGAFLKLDRALLDRELAAHLPPGTRRAARGVIATGDVVVADDAHRDAVRRRVPEALCVEMEGASAAQVCFEHEVPFACVRFISDGAGAEVAREVAPFLGGLAAAYTVGILTRWLGGK